MTAVEKKIAIAVHRTRRIWAYTMVSVTVYTLVTQPLWTALLLIPISIVSYLGFMALTVMWLTTQISTYENDEDDEHKRIKKLHEDLESGELEPGSDEMFRRMHEAGLTEIVPIGEFSPEVLGQFGEYPIHEWVEVNDPATKKMEKFFYHSPMRHEADGTVELPNEEGKIFACVNGIVYARDANG